MKQSDIIIGKLPLTGIVKVDIQKVIKMWNDRWILTQWINDKENKFILSTTKLKLTISVLQAEEIIKKIGLIKVDSFSRSGKSWVTKNVILSVKKKAEEKMSELLSSYEIHVAWVNRYEDALRKNP